MRFITFWGTIACVGCVPSLESKTAGHVGCMPGEIRILEESNSGSAFGQSAHSWVAECGGRRYVCTEVATNQTDLKSDQIVRPVDSDISCTESSKDPDAAHAAGASSESPAALAIQPKSREPEVDPPDGAAGFEFGASEQVTQEMCLESGQDWNQLTKDHFVCSGPIKAVGFQVRAALEFCSDKLCVITLIHRPARDWLESVRGIKTTLEDKYGDPSENSSRLETSCQEDEPFQQCVRNGEAFARVSWKWANKQRVELSATKPTPEEDGEEGPSLRLIYEKAPSAVTADSSAL